METKSARMNLAVTPSTKRTIEETAAALGISQADLVALAVDNWVRTKSPKSASETLAEARQAISDLERLIAIIQATIQG